MYHECVSKSVSTLSDCTSFEKTYRHPILTLPSLPLRDGFLAAAGDGDAFAQSSYALVVENGNPLLLRVVGMNNASKLSRLSATELAPPPLPT